MADKNDNVYRPCYFELFATAEFKKHYRYINNDRDSNYLFYRRDAKEKEQDVAILFRTSHHCWTLNHFRPLDGFNEFKRFNRLYDAVQHLQQAMYDYDAKYAEYRAEQARITEQRRREREEKKRRKLNKSK